MHSHICVSSRAKSIEVITLLNVSLSTDGKIVAPSRTILINEWLQPLPLFFQCWDETWLQWLSQKDHSSVIWGRSNDPFSFYGIQIGSHVTLYNLGNIFHMLSFNCHNNCIWYVLFTTILSVRVKVGGRNYASYFKREKLLWSLFTRFWRPGKTKEKRRENAGLIFHLPLTVGIQRCLLY